MCRGFICLRVLFITRHQVLRLGPLKFENEMDTIRRWTKDGTLSQVNTAHVYA